MENIDIALISESHLASHSQADIRNYRLYTCNHPNDASHGGAATYVRHSTSRHELPSYRTDHLLVDCIAVNLHCGTKVTLAAEYSPPRHKILATEYKTLFKHLGNKFIAGGDYNAKHDFWGSRLTTPKGKERYRAICDTSSLAISNGRPTYWPADPRKHPDCIDFFITHGVSSAYVDLTGYNDLSSDYSALVLTLSDTIIHKGERIHLTSRYTDWNIFRAELNNRINLRVELRTPEDIDKAVSTIQESLTTSARVATPFRQPSKPTTTGYM